MDLTAAVVSFLSTLFGVLIGIPVALLVDRKIGERKKIEKAISKLKVISEELNHNIRLFAQIQDELKVNSMIFYNIDTNAWKTLSIEDLREIISDELIQNIYRAYYEYEHLNRKIDMQFNMHYSSIRNTDAYASERKIIVDAILNHVKTLQRRTSEILNNINTEIENMEKRIATSVSEKTSWRNFLTLLLMWLTLLILVGGKNLYSNIFDQNLSSLIIYGFMAISSLSLSKIFEKRKITEKFGLSKINLVLLLILIFSTLAIMIYFEIFDYRLILLAPLTEELFFRGYMLGFLCKQNYGKKSRIITDAWWISYTSVLFGLSHLMIPEYSIPSLIITLIGGIVFGIFYVYSKTIVWPFMGHLLYNLSLVFGIPEFALYSLIMIAGAIILVSYINIIKRGNQNQ